MATQTPGIKMPSRPAPRAPPIRKPIQNSSQLNDCPIDPFSPPKIKLDVSKEKKRAPPRPPPPRLNTNQGSNHFRSIFGSSKRIQKKGAATAIVKPLPPSKTPDIPIGTLIDLHTPPSSPKSQKINSETIWNTGNISKNSSPFESGFEDDFSSILSSASTTPTTDVWSDLSPDKPEPFVIKHIKPIPPPSTVSSRPTIICVPKAKPSRPPPPRLDGSPPMPSMPPPPPPADLLQVLTNGPPVPPRPLSPYKPKTDSGLPTCKALYDYDSSHPDDLQFKTGDVITILDKEGGGEWLRGRLNGKKGIFPASYVSQQQQTSKSKPLMTVIALFPFTPNSWDDLELQEGDQITVLDRVNDDWLYGECLGKRGLFPECYVQDITALQEDEDV